MQELTDEKEGDELAKLLKFFAEHEQRRVMEDALRRDASIPPALAHFNNRTLWGHRWADKIDAAGARVETFADNQFRKTPEYLPGTAGDAVYAVAEERGKRFEEEHPLQATALDTAAGLVQSAIAKRLRIPEWAAPAIFGALEGADKAPQGERVAGAIGGAAEGTLIDMAGGEAARKLNLDGAYRELAGEAIGAGLERAGEAVAEAARPTPNRAPNRASLPRATPAPRPATPRGARPPAPPSSRPRGAQRVMAGLAASLPFPFAPFPIPRPSTPLALALYNAFAGPGKERSRH